MAEKIKINLLIDANSFSLLSTLEFRRKKLSKLVFDYFNAHTCQTVFEEFSNRISNAGQDNRITYRLLNKKKENIFPISNFTKTIEKQLKASGYFENISSKGKKDKGERHLVCSAIEHVFRGKFSQCVILSDDFKATEGLLGSVNQDFLFGSIWSVFDLVMFLFFKSRITYDDTRYAIRELISSPAVSVKKYRKYNNRSDTVEKARQRLLSDQLKRLGNINRLLNSLPGGNRG